VADPLDAPGRGSAQGPLQASSVGAFSLVADSAAADSVLPPQGRLAPRVEEARSRPAVLRG